MKYQIIINNKIVKEYPHKLQAVVWCFMHGYGYAGKGHRWISGVEIIEKRVENREISPAKRER